MAGAVVSRVTRSQTHRHGQNAATPATDAAHALGSSRATFVATLVAHEELFLDRLVRFLPTDDLVNVCNAISCVRSGRSLLTNATQWQYMAQRDGLAGTAAVTPTVACRVGCQAFRDYANRRSQLERFDACVTVVSGDLETITQVEGVSVDCLAFPTSPSFHNPGIGVAGCVHRRITTDLSRYVPRPSARPRVLDVLTTPGNSADIKLLVHCVGPSQFDNDRRVKLYNTYHKAVCAIKQAEAVHCAAFASISTGTLQYPKPEAAETAIAAVRDVFRSQLWPVDKRIAFVCIDKDVLKAFRRAYALTRRTFFTSPAMFPAPP